MPENRRGSAAEGKEGAFIETCYREIPYKGFLPGTRVPLVPSCNGRGTWMKHSLSSLWPQDESRPSPLAILGSPAAGSMHGPGASRSLSASVTLAVDQQCAAAPPCRRATGSHGASEHT
eukprot:246380-Rhodomonas_salina.1